MRAGKRKDPRLDAAGLWEYALRRLGGRAHSSSELREKLRGRAARAADVPAVLAKLKDLGLLDDQRFAETYASARLANQGFGKGRVLRDLRQRRVAPQVAAGAVDSVFRDTDETALIEEFLRRKFRKVPLPEHLAEPRNLASAYRKLRYAGFSSSGSIRVLKRYAAQADELESPEEEL